EVREPSPLGVEVELDLPAVERHAAGPVQADGVADQVELLDVAHAVLDAEAGADLLEGGAVGQAQPEPLDQVEQQRQAVELPLRDVEAAAPLHAGQLRSGADQMEGGGGEAADLGEVVAGLEAAG